MNKDKLLRAIGMLFVATALISCGQGSGNGASLKISQQKQQLETCLAGEGQKTVIGYFIGYDSKGDAFFYRITSNQSGDNFPYRFFTLSPDGDKVTVKDCRYETPGTDFRDASGKYDADNPVIPAMKKCMPRPDKTVVHY